jgi:ATP-dependent Clp protease ATP-binding subunit ClpX
VESVMMDTMFDAPSKKIKSFEVTEEFVKKQFEKSHLQKLAS